ncbi:MAG: helix-turn-helix domain-containing protein [Bacilli bacterium]
MKYVYLKPELDNLSQGERIAFVRQFRRLTQDNVSEKLGLTGEAKRRTMTRYERGDRTPKKDRLLEIANILNVNVNCIREYEFTKTEDIIYFLLWLEEIYPKMNIDFCISEYFHDSRDNMLIKFKEEWEYMRNLRETREISYEKYIEWKLNYEVKEG